MACEGCGKTGSCGCFVRGGLNVDVVGSGTTTDPYVVNVGRQYIEGLDTATAITQVTGNGDPNNPYFISISAADAGTPGTWTGADADWISLAAVDPATSYVVVKQAV